MLTSPSVCSYFAQFLRLRLSPGFGLVLPSGLDFHSLLPWRFLRIVVQSHISSLYLDTLSLDPGMQSITTCLCLIQTLPGESGEDLTESELCAF